MASSINNFDGARVAQALVLPLSGVLTGSIAAFSWAAIPILSSVGPSDAVKLWSALYARGAANMPPVALATTSLYVYLAVQSRHIPTATAHTSSTSLYAAAAVLTISIVPYTLTAMKGVNDRLHAIADAPLEESKATVVAEKGEVETLLRKWYLLNLVRSLLPAVGCVLGVVAAW